MISLHWALGPQGDGTQGMCGLSEGLITSGSLLQLKNGSPLKPFGQEQIGLWLTTLHSALAPHVPGQGSAHFCWTQALVRGHSELRRHSGLQLGGPPKYPLRQEHTGLGPSALHSLLGPHGSGLQGSVTVGATREEKLF